jgi:hypothetical protein
MRYKKSKKLLIYYSYFRISDNIFDISKEIAAISPKMNRIKSANKMNIHEEIKKLKYKY